MRKIIYLGAIIILTADIFYAYSGVLHPVYNKIEYRRLDEETQLPVEVEHLDSADAYSIRTCFYWNGFYFRKFTFPEKDKCTWIERGKDFS